MISHLRCSAAAASLTPLRSEGKSDVRWSHVATVRRVPVTRRPRALFLCPALDNGGVERHWAGLLPALVTRGLAVRVVAIEGGGRALASLRASGVPVRELGATGLPSVAVLPRLLHERRGSPGVVVTWGFNAHALGAVFARATGAPQVLNWHRQPDLPFTGVQRPAVRMAGRSGAGAIAVSAAQLPDLRALGFAAERIRIVANGAPAAPAGDTPRPQLRAELDLPQDSFVVALVCRLRPEKRVGDFISALGSLEAAVPNVVGVIVGDGEMEGELRRQADETGAPIRFAGFQPEPSRYMRAADVVCLTSEFEALPMVLVEALACGRACVATRVGGTSEIVIDGDNGLLFPPGDRDALVRSLRRLAEEPELTQAMGQRSLRRWRAAYTFDVMADRYLELLTTVAGPPTTWRRS